MATPEEEDATAGRQFAADEDVADVGYSRPEVAVLAEADWQRHTMPPVAFDRLKLAAVAVLSAEAELDDAVAQPNLKIRCATHPMHHRKLLGSA